MPSFRNNILKSSRPTRRNPIEALSTPSKMKSKIKADVSRISTFQSPRMALEKRNFQPLSLPSMPSLRQLLVKRKIKVGRRQGGSRSSSVLTKFRWLRCFYCLELSGTGRSSWLTGWQKWGQERESQLFWHLFVPTCLQWDSMCAVLATRCT